MSNRINIRQQQHLQSVAQLTQIKLSDCRWVFELGDAFHVTELYVGISILTWRERKKDSALDFVADTTGKFISATAKNWILATHTQVLPPLVEDEKMKPVALPHPSPQPLAAARGEWTDRSPREEEERVQYQIMNELIVN